MTAFLAAICIILVSPLYLLTHPVETILWLLLFVVFPIVAWKLLTKLFKYLGLE